MTLTLNVCKLKRLFLSAPIYGCCRPCTVTRCSAFVIACVVTRSVDCDKIFHCRSVAASVLIRYLGVDYTAACMVPIPLKFEIATLTGLSTCLQSINHSVISILRHAW
jgi:hypothetical protein